jgi:hypothetical protein
MICPDFAIFSLPSDEAVPEDASEAVPAKVKSEAHIEG